MLRNAAGLLLTVAAFVSAGCGVQPTTTQKSSATATTTVPISSGSLALMQLRMVTSSAGWALAVPADGHGLGHLVRTTDGGVHWKAVGLPTDLNTPNIDAVDFHDDQHAWLLVMLGAESTSSHELVVVASTADGGSHWAVTPRFGIDGNGTGIQFIDAAHGWIFATPGAGGAVGAGDTTLYRTVDAGEHWQVIKPPSEVRQVPTVVGGLPEACPMGGPIGRPIFTDSQTGWLGAFCKQLFFYVTADGGLSWHPQSLPPFPGAGSAVPPSDLLFNVDSFDRTSAIDFSVFVHRGVTTGANALQEAAIYVSHDAGHSWTALRLPYAELSADFVDPMHGWMIGAGPGGDTEKRSLYSTVDGGLEWRLADGPQDYFGHELNFVDTTTGFIAVQATTDKPSQLMRTSDGGATWAPISTVVS